MITTSRLRLRWPRFRTRTLLAVMTVLSIGLGAALYLWPSPRASTAVVPVLGPITDGGKTTALPPPSDAEVMRALQRALPRGANVPTMNVRIVREKVADYVDPVRVYPMIGPGQQHHAHYRCSIYFSRGAYRPDGRHIITVDHNHLHMVGEETPSM